MSTWTFERFALCLCLTLATAACNPDGGFRATIGGKSFASPGRDAATASARLADGGLTLVSPAGFCIDRRSLEPNFAVLARCDILGAPNPGEDTPLGLILVSVTETPATQVDLETALAALTPPSAELLERRLTGSLALMKLRGPTPGGTDRRHWKGVAQIGSHLLGLTVFAPPNGRMTGAAGAQTLDQLVQRTRDSSDIQSAPADAPAESARPRRGGFLSGLFDRNPLD